MKTRIKIVIAFAFLIAVIFTWPKEKRGTIAEAKNFSENYSNVEEVFHERTTDGKLNVVFNGKNISNLRYGFVMTDSMEILMPSDFIEQIMGCAVVRLDEDKFVIQKRDVRIEMSLSSRSFLINGINKEITELPILKQRSGIILIPIKELIEYLGYKAEYNYQFNCIRIEQFDFSSPLPTKYDMRIDNRVTDVRDQGIYGTCWAFASLGAMESTLMPLEKNIFSTDHMAMNNSYKLDLNEGGEGTISLAYLASWKGPVYEKDDPYGDGKTNDRLEAVKHLEEAIILKTRDDEAIKSAIYEFGGVETSLYLGMVYTGYYSRYYDSENYSYYYNGPETPNHAVVVVGWDDDYPKERFVSEPSRNGAFICKNSWGTDFGENGYFYVSYDDVNICQNAVVYSKVGNKDNFDNIYQTDMLGWVGQIGFEEGSAYFAHCYTARADEELEAVSFYATDVNTSFSVYYVPEFEDVSSFIKKEHIVDGNIKYAGYYTVRLPEKKQLKKGERFAVVVHITTPSTTKPIAVEMRADEKTASADISDGEGYASRYGDIWIKAEDRECDICLKAFTNNKKNEK